MALKSLTYTSLAQLDLTASDVDDIHRSARHLNALDGITGLLIFNGTHFLQMIEGAPDAIDALVAKLRRDSRHVGFEIRHEEIVSRRSFPDWSMELVRIDSNQFEAKTDIAKRLPAELAPHVRDRVVAMTEAISGIVTF